MGILQKTLVIVSMSRMMKITKSISLKPRKLSRLSIITRQLSNDSVPLAYDDYNSGDSKSKGSPFIISHGMLGSRANWTSLGKQIHRKTGRRVITVDARNHGESPHTETMSYRSMAGDLARLVDDLGIGGEEVTLVGHSMGGRTSMCLALENTSEINLSQLIVVDISPVNQQFDVTSSNEWNMEHYFHCLKAVTFSPGLQISAARRDADKQLATRIKDPGLRAWLLMNVTQDESGKVGWKINIDTIHKAFKESIAVFPEIHNSFDRPTLFIGGAESDYIPVSDHDQILEQFPRARFEYVQGAGHWVHSQKPAEFMDVLMNNLV